MHTVGTRNGKEYNVWSFGRRGYHLAVASGKSCKKCEISDNNLIAGSYQNLGEMQ